MALINQFIGYWEYNMKLVVVKSNFSILLVPNYREFQITVIYVKTLYVARCIVYHYPGRQKVKKQDLSQIDCYNCNKMINCYNCNKILVVRLDYFCIRECIERWFRKKMDGGIVGVQSMPLIWLAIIMTLAVR